MHRAARRRGREPRVHPQSLAAALPGLEAKGFDRALVLPRKPAAVRAVREVVTVGREGARLFRDSLARMLAPEGARVDRRRGLVRDPPTRVVVHTRVGVHVHRRREVGPLKHGHTCVLSQNQSVWVCHPQKPVAPSQRYNSIRLLDTVFSREEVIPDLAAGSSSGRLGTRLVALQARKVETRWGHAERFQGRPRLRHAHHHRILSRKGEGSETGGVVAVELLK